VPVTVGAAETKDVPVFVRGIGTVQAFKMVIVKSRVDGHIVKVSFEEGQEVKVGDPLFQIDPRPFQATLDQALANKQKDEAQLQGAQLDLERYGKLLAPGFQSRQSYDQQKATVDALKGSIAADQAAIDTARLNLTYADIRSPIDGRTSQRLVDLGKPGDDRPEHPAGQHQPKSSRSSLTSRCRRTRPTRSAPTRPRGSSRCWPMPVTTRRCWPRAR